MLYQGCQNEIGNDTIKKYGCYFLSIMRLVELDEGKDFAQKEISVYWEAARLKGLINPDFEITDAAAVYNLLAGKNVYRHVLKQPEKPDAAGYFTRLVKPDYTHYVLSYDGGIWDSLDPKRPAAKAYRPESYRVLS
jgi:hypothetical protein